MPTWRILAAVAGLSWAIAAAYLLMTPNVPVAWLGAILMFLIGSGLVGRFVRPGKPDEDRVVFQLAIRLVPLTFLLDAVAIGGGKAVGIGLTTSYVVMAAVILTTVAYLAARRAGVLKGPERAPPPDLL
jgi:hypothetical protein